MPRDCDIIHDSGQQRRNCCYPVPTMAEAREMGSYRSSAARRVSSLSRYDVIVPILSDATRDSVARTCWSIALRGFDLYYRLKNVKDFTNIQRSCTAFLAIRTALNREAYRATDFEVGRTPRPRDSVSCCQAKLISNWDNCICLATDALHPDNNGNTRVSPVLSLLAVIARADCQCLEN